jgi:hypothetical protein
MCAAAAGALVRRDHETGGASLRVVPYICLGLLVAGAAVVSFNFALAGTMLTLAMISAAAALATYAVGEGWDPMFAIGLFSGAFAVILVLGGQGETAATLM